MHVHPAHVQPSRSLLSPRRSPAVVPPARGIHPRGVYPLGHLCPAASALRRFPPPPSASRCQPHPVRVASTVARLERRRPRPVYSLTCWRTAPLPSTSPLPVRARSVEISPRGRSVTSRKRQRWGTSL